MTDKEIIKALECCVTDGYTCNKCPYEYTKHIINEEYEIMPNGKHYDEWSCDEWLKKDLLDLINRQRAEIERLKNFIEKRKEIVYRAYIDDLYAETKNKAEAIKDFAEIIISDYPEMEYYIDNLVKEMIGEQE